MTASSGSPSPSAAALAYYDAFPAYYNGSYCVLVGHYTSASAASSTAAASPASGASLSPPLPSPS